ncbi:hypothetical protein HK405_002285 [Cladochytrium tenue]|nr:hypothetical protein HK405_002285 [Cladochytrium tenue]
MKWRTVDMRVDIAFRLVNYWVTIVNVNPVKTINKVAYENADIIVVFAQQRRERYQKIDDVGTVGKLCIHPHHLVSVMLAAGMERHLMFLGLFAAFKILLDPQGIR